MYSKLTLSETIAVGLTYTGSTTNLNTHAAQRLARNASEFPALISCNVLSINEKTVCDMIKTDFSKFTCETRFLLHPSVLR